MKPNIILDFDGVINNQKYDAEKFKKILIKKFGEKEFEIIEKKIEKNPLKYWWIVQGERTAPSDSDFLIKYGVVGNILSRKIDKSGNLTLNLFDKATRNNKPHFFKDMKKTISKLKKKYNIIVVSNSEAVKIRRMLKKEGINVKVIGWAKKYLVDNSFDKVEKSIKVGSISIPVRRPFYYKILKKLKPEFVVSDVFAVDLSLPYIMGIKIILKKNSYTPEYSLDFVKKNGRVIKDLSDLI